MSFAYKHKFITKHWHSYIYVIQRKISFQWVNFTTKQRQWNNYNEFINGVHYDGFLSGSGGRLYDLPSGVIQQVGGSWLCMPMHSVTCPALFILSLAGQHLLKKYQQYHSWLPNAFLYINRNVWLWYINNLELPLVFINIPENYIML